MWSIQIFYKKVQQAHTTSSATNQIIQQFRPNKWQSKALYLGGKKNDNNKLQDQTYFIEHVKMTQTQQTHSKVNAHYTLHITHYTNTISR